MADLLEKIVIDTLDDAEALLRVLKSKETSSSCKLLRYVASAYSG